MCGDSDSNQEVARMSKSELIDLVKDLQGRLDEHEARKTGLEKACGESQRLLDALMANTAAEVGFKDRDGRYILVSRQQAEITGFPPESMTGKTAYDIYPAETAKAIAAHDELVMKRGEPAEREIELAGDEGPRTFLAIKFPLFGESGHVSGIGAIANEITDRKQAEKALRASEARYRELFDESPVAIWEEDWSAIRQMVERLARQGIKDWRSYFRRRKDQLEKAYNLAIISDVSRATLEIYQAADKKQLMERTRSQLVPEEELDAFVEILASFLEGKSDCVAEARDLRTDGSEMIIRSRAVLPPKHRSRWERVIYAIEEITAQKQTEDALRKRDAQVKQAHEVAKIGYWSRDASTDLLSISPELATILRVSPDAVENLTSDEFTERIVHPEDRSRVWQVTELVNDDNWRFEVEYRLKPEAGGTRWVREVGESLLDENGQVTSEIGTIQDITDYKTAEEKLRQAESLQAVGQLTGGVAHDFNNLLAVIMGNAEVLMLRGGTQDQPIQAILRAASRGAELTQRLLAFSRQQPLDPQIIAVDSLLSDMTGMLHRTLGENIAIKTTSARDVWQILADPGQLETALLNLAINARDAMPEGGTLTIEAANLMSKLGDPIDQAEITSGPCVVLTVSDTGCGMPLGVQERAFEPFFTTKDVGEGSGLGLSMVYGFAKQSGGHMSIHSREGHGTTVRLYLPRAMDGAVRASPQATPEEPKGQGETILVLEDDADVRELAVTLLRDLGYEVLEAKDGEAALDLLTGDTAIDLLLTDVVLPGGLNGPEVVERARRQDNSLKVLFMSGYAERVINKGSLIAGAGELLNKPFRRAELADKMRAALEAPP
jgi:PAS domain S-box-containing protein